MRILYHALCIVQGRGVSKVCKRHSLLFARALAQNLRCNQIYTNCPYHSEDKRPRIYTRTGDKGTSGLFTGERRAKDDAIFEALGSIDELTSYLSLSREFLAEDQTEISQLLTEIQCVLQDINSVIATPQTSARASHLNKIQLDPNIVNDLEKWIDYFSERIPPLNAFILPAGGKASSSIHVARTVCRRAERRIVPLVDSDTLGLSLRYINRLSDLLFTLARYTAHAQGEQDLIYKQIQRHKTVHDTGKRKFSSWSRTQAFSSSSFDDLFAQSNRVRVQKHLAETTQRHSFSTTSKPLQAAVLIPLCFCDNIPSLLYTLRSKAVPKHRGEVCFPGGMRSSADVDLNATALREAEEEIGISSEKVDIWGTMHAVPTRDGSVLITPVVGYIGHVDVENLSPCDVEVEEIITQPVSLLCDPAGQGTTQFGKYTLPVFLGTRYRIWGITATITHLFLSVLAPDLYKLKLNFITKEKLGL